jgi:hypothetical protein
LAIVAFGIGAAVTRAHAGSGWAAATVIESWR